MTTGGERQGSCGGYADSAMLIRIPIRLPADNFAMAFFYDRDTQALETYSCRPDTSIRITLGKQ
jgi:hypothetical protein